MASTPSKTPNSGAVRKAPNLSDLRKFAVNRPGAIEAIYEPLYDYQTYPAAGTSTLSFFQNPVGQNSTTLEDTNMRAAGSMPSPQQFLVTNIQVDFRPGISPTTLGAADANSFTKDAEKILSQGVLRFTVGSKDYLVSFPLGLFPPVNRLTGYAALSNATTAAAGLATRIDYAQAGGPMFQLTPVLLQSTQNFVVRLEWPDGVVATPSTVAGRIGVRLGGYLYRNSQ